MATAIATGVAVGTPNPPPAPTVVRREDTVPPRVEFRDRKVTDVWWGILYALSYLAFIACGGYIATNAHNRYEYDENDNKVISAYFMEDAVQCCARARGDVDGDYTWGVCAYLQEDNGRRLQAGDSKFSGDEGMFEAFLEAPEIPILLFALTVVTSIVWVVLLRYFSKPIVIITEVAKIAFFIGMGVIQDSQSTMTVCFVVAFLLIVYDYWVREKILFAAEVISHATIAMRARPSIFVGGILIKTLFAGNAVLFVLFFAKAFDVVEIKSSGYGACYFETPEYVSNLMTFCSVSYLWTILLLDKMRLSIIATIVGSWHFHPTDKPKFTTTLTNMGKSFGTLSIGSLISAIADQINRIAQQNWFCIVLSPPNLIICLIGTCFQTCVQMLTKFSIILHVFTGQGFFQSGKSMYKIMCRHFKGGFVTEVTSKSVLEFTSYVFAAGITMLTWRWVNDRFDCGNPFNDGLNDDDDTSGFVPWYIIVGILVNVFLLWYPVLFLYCIIFTNNYLRKNERETLQRIEDNENSNLDDQYNDDNYGYVERNYNHIWIPILSASFVGCIAMMFFSFISSIFLDVIDTIFLCFAIDKDNNVDIAPDNELFDLVKKMPEYIDTVTVVDDDVEGTTFVDNVESRNEVTATLVHEETINRDPSAPPPPAEAYTSYK